MAATAKKPTKKTAKNAPAERPSTFGAIFANASAQAQAEQAAPDVSADVSADVPEHQERAEAVTEKLTGTPIGKAMLAGVLTDGVEKIMGGVGAFLTTLEGYAEEIEIVTAEDGTEYRLITLAELTGWRRRQAWATLLSITSAARVYVQNGLDIATIAGQIAGGEKGVELLGLMFGPVGVPYDKERAEEYGEAVDNALNTKQIAGVILRFFSLNVSVILPVIHSSLGSLIAMVTSFDADAEATNPATPRRPA